MTTSRYNRIIDACTRHSIEPTEHCIYVSIGEKIFFHYQGETERESYPCAFGINPPSCIENSLGTPLGLHHIDQKIGDEAELGMVFKGRVPTGKKYWECEGDTQNKITTRILWLRGLENGYNAGPGCDSFNRYIYIHGTNQEADFDKARSHGCVLLKNEDVIRVYSALPEKSIVLIEK